MLDLKQLIIVISEGYIFLCPHLYNSKILIIQNKYLYFLNLRDSTLVLCVLSAFLIISLRKRQGFFQQFCEKAPGQNWRKMMDLTLKLGEN